MNKIRHKLIILGLIFIVLSSLVGCTDSEEAPALKTANEYSEIISQKYTDELEEIKSSGTPFNESLYISFLKEQYEFLGETLDYDLMSSISNKRDRSIHDFSLNKTKEFSIWEKYASDNNLAPSEGEILDFAENNYDTQYANLPLSLQKQIETEIIIQKFSEKIKEKEILVTDKEIQSYYDEHSEEFMLPAHYYLRVYEFFGQDKEKLLAVKEAETSKELFEKTSINIENIEFEEMQLPVDSFDNFPTEMKELLTKESLNKYDYILKETDELVGIIEFISIKPKNKVPLEDVYENLGNFLKQKKSQEMIQEEYEKILNTYDKL